MTRALVVISLHEQYHTLITPQTNHLYILHPAISGEIEREVSLRRIISTSWELTAPIPPELDDPKLRLSISFRWSEVYCTGIFWSQRHFLCFSFGKLYSRKHGVNSVLLFIFAFIKSVFCNNNPMFWTPIIELFYYIPSANQFLRKFIKKHQLFTVM